MGKNITLSEQTFEVFDEVRDALGLRSDRLVRILLDAMFPGIFEDSEVDPRWVELHFAEWLSLENTIRDVDGVRPID